jgi:hypothetical protein
VPSEPANRRARRARGPELARRNAAGAGLTNVEFHRGYIEQIPLADGHVDVEIRATHRVHEHASSAIIRARKPAHY